MVETYTSILKKKKCGSGTFSLIIVYPIGMEKKKRFFSGFCYKMMAYLSYASSLREEKDVLGLVTQRKHLSWIPPVWSYQNSRTLV